MTDQRRAPELALLLALAAAGLIAILMSVLDGPATRPVADPTPAVPTPSPAETPCREALGRADPPPGVRVTLHAKPATLGRNEELRFTVSLRNGGPSAVGFYRGRDWVDLWIYRGDEFIWTKSKAGGFYTREALIESLAPGDSRAEDVTWDQSSNCPGAPPTVTAGRYFARASLKVETASGTVTWWSEAIQFTIRP